MTSPHKIKPTAGRIAVEVNDDNETETATGIILVRDANRKPTSGRVVAVCDDYEYDGDRYQPLFQLGDFVIFGQYSGTEVKVDRKRVIVLRESDILCRIVTEDGERRPAVSITNRGDIK